MLLCEPAIDMPDWWISGKHDKDLLQGVARHGMARMDYYVLNDAELSFKDILKRHLCNETLLDKKSAAEYEKARTKAKNDLKFDFEFDEDEEDSVDLKKIKAQMKKQELKKQQLMNKNKDEKDSNNDKKTEPEVDDQDNMDEKTEENDDKKEENSKDNDNFSKNNKDLSTPEKSTGTGSKTTSPEKKGGKRSASVSISPPQITLQQMEQMAKGGIIYDMGK